jgi:hypothetical protein
MVKHEFILRTRSEAKGTKDLATTTMSASSGLILRCAQDDLLGELNG